MSRLALLASSAFFALATVAQATPVTFVASPGGSNLALTCGPAKTTCTRLKAELDFDEDDVPPSSELGPAFSFGFIEFDGKDPVIYKSRGPKPADSKNKFSSTFGITATLAFRILGIEPIYNVVATGEGKFSVEKDKITFLELFWFDTPDVTVPGVGTFAFSFSNIGGPSVFAARTGGRSGDSNGDNTNGDNDDDLMLAVNATVENVSVVPLPGGVVLLLSALGLIGVGAVRRRRAATA